LVLRYGEIRTALESKGQTIGPLDMLIAAHALTLDLTIISNNIKEFSRILVPGIAPFWFAHLHPLELFYENGFTGVLLVYGGLAGLFGLTIKTLKNTISKNIALLIKCMLVIFLCWMIHSNLTFPFYSKYAQYPLDKMSNKVVGADA